MTARRPSLMVVDDEPGIVDVVSRFARRAGFDVITCPGGQAISRLRMRSVDLVMVDLRTPSLGGLGALRAIRETDPHCQTILMRDHATVDTAVEAIKLGAMDYLSKPIDCGRLEQLLVGVREEMERRRSLLTIESDLARRLEFCGLVGRGPAMQELIRMIRRLAPHARTALVTGETGTGKELVARALHRTGPRRERSLVTVNCCAVVETLFDRELFGHVRGAFAGVTENKPGLLEQADGGTLFLDEIGGLPSNLQAKLLGVLERGAVQRVGSADTWPVNVNVIAATNRDLRAEVAAGRFRSDLYYRLNIVEFHLPPLRERREDIPYLTASFVRDAADCLQKAVLGVTPGAERLLAVAPWEGNVRELRNVIERACILADGEFVTERELAITMPSTVVAAIEHRSKLGVPIASPLSQPPEADLLVNVERDHIRRALERSGGNKKAAAKMLGLSRRALYRRLERLDLSATITRRRDALGEMIEA